MAARVNALRTISIAGAAALLSSCSPPEIQIVVEKADGRLRVALSQDWGLVFSDRQTPCVEEIGLYEPQTYEPADAVWLIKVEGDVQCLDLAAFTVGEVPKGWRQLVPLSAGRGRTYALRADGIGWGETNLTF